MSSFLSFFKKKSVKQIVQENQRILNKSIRELDREKNKLELNERKLISEIKILAQKNQNDACKTLANEVVFIRKNISQIYNTRAKLTGISMKLQSIKNTDMVAQAMKNSAKTMNKMNQTMKIPEIQRMFASFEKNTDMLDVKTEMVEDLVSDALDSEETTQETNSLVDNVLSEIGISLSGQMPSLEEKKEKQNAHDLLKKI